MIINHFSTLASVRVDSMLQAHITTVSRCTDQSHNNCQCQPSWWWWWWSTLFLRRQTTM